MGRENRGPYARQLCVRHRLARRVIIEGPSPVPLDAVVHEAVLRIMVGTRAAARARLAHILELSEAAHITVQVIPFEQEGFAWGSSSMAYVGGSLEKLDTVIRDGPTGVLYIDEESQLDTYRARFRRVQTLALDPVRSRDLIGRLAKEL